MESDAAVFSHNNTETKASKKQHDFLLKSVTNHHIRSQTTNQSKIQFLMNKKVIQSDALEKIEIVKIIIWITANYPNFI